VRCTTSQGNWADILGTRSQFPEGKNTSAPCSTIERVRVSANRNVVYKVVCETPTMLSSSTFLGTRAVLEYSLRLNRHVSFPALAFEGRSLLDSWVLPPSYLAIISPACLIPAKFSILRAAILPGVLNDSVQIVTNPTLCHLLRSRRETSHPPHPCQTPNQGPFSLNGLLRPPGLEAETPPRLLPSFNLSSQIKLRRYLPLSPQTPLASAAENQVHSHVQLEKLSEG